MACRPGLLRGERSLRAMYTGFAVGLPMVGAKILVRYQREPHPKVIYKSRSDRRPRRAPAQRTLLLRRNPLRTQIPTSTKTVSLDGTASAVPSPSERKRGFSPRGKTPGAPHLDFEIWLI